MEKKTIVRSNLQALADAKGVSLREVARSIDVGFESVRRVANDISTSYSRELIEKFCDYFECDHAAIFVTEKISQESLD
jgi:putative transcriptional regulator